MFKIIASRDLYTLRYFLLWDHSRSLVFKINLFVMHKHSSGNKWVTYFYNNSYHLLSVTRVRPHV